MLNYKLAEIYSLEIIRRKLNVVGEFLVGVAVTEIANNKAIDTGMLMNSIAKKITSGNKELVLSVGTDVQYAPYVEFGTGIYADNGKGRKTPWVVVDAKVGGKIITFRTVGQKPKPFLRPLLKKTREISIIFERA